MAVRKRLGDILLDQGLINEEQLADALDNQRRTGEKLGEAVVNLGYVSAEQIADTLSDHLRIPRADLGRRYVQADAMDVVPAEMLDSNEVLPIERTRDKLTLAMVDPLNIMIIDELQRLTGLYIQPLIATKREIRDARSRSTNFSTTARRVVDEYDDRMDEPDMNQMDRDNLEEFVGDAPGVKLGSLILTQAARAGASDIHLEPREGELRVRYRVDGLLQDVMTVPRKFMSDVSSRIKIMANLDITERRRPQDGRIKTDLDGIMVDMRISTLPTIYGEKIVARLLSSGQDVKGVESFGFSDDSVDKIKRMLRQSRGMILVTGPTGSGKTTTLYGFLQRLNSPEQNIITIEDPVEYELQGINQVAVNTKVDLTFATGLRTVLRQDPDIIMVGEIRDQETAEIAVRSALTGHLVLSTLHTNNSAATIARWIDMGVEPFLLSSTLVGIMAQRLVRNICKDCKEQIPLEDPLMIRFIRGLGMEVPEYVHHGTGCPSCKDTGYQGRAAIEEVLLVTRELRDAINKGATEERLQELAITSGMVTLAERAVAKLVAGETTVSEVIRTVYSVEDEEAMAHGQSVEPA